MKTLAEAENDARSIVNAWTAVAGGVGWVPGSTLMLGGGDWLMINKVANAFGVTNYSKEQVVATIAACTGGKWLAETLSFIPVAGWIIKSGIAAGLSKALGEAVITHFKKLSTYS